VKKLDLETGRPLQERRFTSIVGIGHAGPFVCVAEPKRLTFFRGGTRWSIDLDEPIYFLRSVLDR
jgi:hypothetical protein